MLPNDLPRGGYAWLWPLAFFLLLSTGAYPAPPEDGRALGIVVEDASVPHLDRVGTPYGVSVKAVMRWSAAERAGVQPGDVLSSLDGSPLYSTERLKWLVSRRPPGEKVTLKVHRSGAEQDRERSVEVVLDPVVGAGDEVSLPQDTGTDAAMAVSRNEWASLGIRMQPLTNALRETYGVPRDRGILISDIDSGGPADRAGLRAGDVLLRIDRRPIGSPADAYRALGFFDPGTSVELEAVRAGNRRTLAATLGAAKGEAEGAGSERIGTVFPRAERTTQDSSGSGHAWSLWEAMPGGVPRNNGWSEQDAEP